MPDMKFLSYFYGDEAMQFTYFRIPCQLITHPRFKHLSTDSKLLYGMLLDRMSLSIKNEWYDDTRCVYIYNRYILVSGIWVCAAGSASVRTSSWTKVSALWHCRCSDG